MLETADDTHGGEPLAKGKITSRTFITAKVCAQACVPELLHTGSYSGR